MSLLLRVSIGFIVCIVVIGLAASKWKTAGRSLLFILIFEGVFRKWLLPSASDFIYFFKDWVLIGSLIGAYRARWSYPSMRWRGMPIWLWTIFGLVALETLNPVMASPVAGVVGLKMWILWPLFVFLVPRIFDDLADFKRFVDLFVIAFFLVAGLAIVQFRLPPSHFLNQYVREQESTATFGDLELVRVCSTFPYLTGFTNYLTFCPCIFLPAALFFRGKSVLLLQYAAVPLMIGVSFMSGARLMLYYLAIFVPVFVMLGLASGAIRIERLVKMLVVTAGLSAGLVLLNPTFRDALQGLLQRNAALSIGTDTAIGRSIGTYSGVFEYPTFSWFGEGVGSTAEAPRAVASLVGMPVAPSSRYAETEAAHVMVETGVFGVALWTGFKVYLVGLSWIMYRQRRGQFQRGVSLAVFLYLVIFFSAGPSFDHTIAPFYWFNVGLLFLMEKLDIQQAVTGRRLERGTAGARRGMIGSSGRPVSQ